MPSTIRRSLFAFLLLCLPASGQTIFNPYSPTADRQVPTWNATAQRFEWANPEISRHVIAVAGVRRDALWIADGDAGTSCYVGYGVQTTTELGTKTAVSPDATNPVTCRHTSAASSGDDIGTQADFYTLRTGRNIRYQVWVKVPTITTVRLWLCVTNQDIAVHANADNPAGNYACFRFSTDASDTNWKLVTKDGTTQNVTDSGIAVNTSGHYFEIFENSALGQWSFFIDNALVGAISTNIPSASTNLKAIAGGETRAAAARDIDVGWVYTESDK